MTGTTTQDTAHSTTLYGGPEQELGGSSFQVSWLWIVWTPALLAAAGLFVWGFWMLFASGPAPLVPDLGPDVSGLDLIGPAIVLALAPYGIYAALRNRRQHKLEEQFPDFLTDLAANRRAGFTLAESVRLAADSDYGPLTEDVHQMAAQLSWNMPFEEALERFAHRVDTPLIRRSITLVLEAERTGGHITDVLSAVARDARQIKRLDRERRLSMRMYTIVMYVTFLVFLAVVVVLQSQLLPQLVAATEATRDGALSQFASGATTLQDHRTFFYTATLVQALGSGSMAGMMAHGNPKPGMLHAAAMALAGVGTFVLIL